MLNARASQVVIDNVVDGFNLHDLFTGEFIRNYPTGPVRKKFSKQVAFGEEGRIVVGGTDQGAVYVFDKNDGKVLSILRHGDRGIVATLTVSPLYYPGGRSLIFLDSYWQWYTQNFQCIPRSD